MAFYLVLQILIVKTRGQYVEVIDYQQLSLNQLFSGRDTKRFTAKGKKKL